VGSVVPKEHAFREQVPDHEMGLGMLSLRCIAWRSACLHPWGNRSSWDDGDVGDGAILKDAVDPFRKG